MFKLIIFVGKSVEKMKDKVINRWGIALAGTMVHLFLGTVYAWSFFQKPISETYGWSQSETAWAFSISIFMLGLTASWCGGKIQKIGVRKLALVGVCLYALGYIISYFALFWQSLPLLYLGFGVVGGIGLGMAYVTPVATVGAWFPEKQGLITGMVVMGFGLGAFVMSKLLAPIFLQLFEGNLSLTFLAIGILLLVFLPPSAWFLKAKPLPQTITDREEVSVSQHIFKVDYWFIWLIFSFNIIAGMIFIAFQSPLLQDILKLEGISDAVSLEQKGATLIGVSALFNGVGRFLWGSISDKIGRMTSFRLILLIEIIIFLLLIFTKNSLIFFAGVCVVLLCYGGGFGVLPSLIKEKYGTRLMASIYGITLIGWGVGGIAGPQITAYMKDFYPTQAGIYSFYIGLGLVVLGFILSFFVKMPKKE